MHELAVRGEIKTIAAREGSSGVFTGTIEGLYQGYRFGSSNPEEHTASIDVPHGTIALRVVQQIVTPLPPRPAVHPFADGNDPFENPEEFLRKLFGSGQGRPPAPPVAGAPPVGQRGPQMREAPGVEGGEMIFKRVHYMETKIHIDPERSRGIFAGATGEMEVVAPNYRMPGYLVVDTAHGDLRLNFLEKGTRETLNADLWVDGENSTGIYANARGELEFSLTVTPPVFGRGPYSGKIWLENAPAAA